MKWMKKYPVAKYHSGSTRIKRKFLFIPKCLPLSEAYSSDIDLQWRWLEITYINQRCIDTWYLFGRYWYMWKNNNWTDKEQWLRFKGKWRKENG